MIDTHRISVSEATILGDGTVALIVDVPKLIDQAEQEEARVIDMAFTFFVKTIIKYLRKAKRWQIRKDASF